MQVVWRGVFTALKLLFSWCCIAFFLVFYHRIRTLLYNNVSLRRVGVVGRRQSGGVVCAGEPRDALVTMTVAPHRIYVVSRATKASLCRVGGASVGDKVV